LQEPVEVIDSTTVEHHESNIPKWQHWIAFAILIDCSAWLFGWRFMLEPQLHNQDVFKSPFVSSFIFIQDFWSLLCFTHIWLIPTIWGKRKIANNIVWKTVFGFVACFTVVPGVWYVEHYFKPIIETLLMSGIGLFSNQSNELLEKVILSALDAEIASIISVLILIFLARVTIWRYGRMPVSIWEFVCGTGIAATIISPFLINKNNLMTVEGYISICMVMLLLASILQLVYWRMGVVNNQNRYFWQTRKIVATRTSWVAGAFLFFYIVSYL
jgi:hypothetical protein